MAGLAITFGSGAMTNSMEEIRNTECIFIIGSNTSENHPVIGMDVMKRVRDGKTRLIVADPRRIPIVDFASLWLRQKPGTDIALINGLLNVIITEGLADEAFIRERTEGFLEVKETVSEYTPEMVSGITGVSAEDIRKAARLYAESSTALILYAMGITQHTSGTENVIALANLAMATGHVGKEGSGVCPLRGQNNVQGACDMGGLPNVFPGYQQVANDEARTKFEKAWSVKLSGKPGLPLTDMMHAAETGKIKGMYIMGEEPALTDPNSAHIQKALMNLDFLVTQNIFLGETGMFADVVLPAAGFAEKDGTFTNTERRVQRVRKGVEPVGRSKPDGVIVSELSEKMGFPMRYADPAEIMEEIASLTPIYGGIHYDRLEGLGLQWPCKTREDPGTKFLHKGAFSRGLGKFTPTKYKDPEEQPDQEYPFIFTTGRVLYHFHAGAMTRNAQGLEEMYSEALAEIHPEDAEALGCVDGDWVELSSKRGKVQTRVQVTERSPRGVAFMTFHFKEAPANMITTDATDPIAKIPGFKFCSVAIRKDS